MRLYKLLILPILMMPFAMTEVAHAGVCGSNTLAFSGNQEPDDDEFLYNNKDEFDKTVAAYNSTGNSSGDGHGWECDNDFCSNGRIQSMPAGHYFEGKIVNHKETYQCCTFWGGGCSSDMWIPTGAGQCDAGVYGKLYVGQCATSGGQCKELTSVDCSPFKKTDELGTKFNLICRDGPNLVCKAIECREGFKPDNAGKCINDKGNPEPDPKPDPKPDPDQKKKGGGGGSSCYADPRRTNAELKGCCDLKSSEATPDWANGKCVCTDPNKKFAFDSKGKGTCVAKDAVVEKPKCDCSTKVTVITAATSACGSSNATVTQAITTINTECSKSSDQCDGTTYQQAVTVINEIIAAGGCKTKPEEPKKPEINKKRLAEAITAIDKYRSGLDVSVWKDAEGNFNTARLVSDSIAGVVLGTAGGLITSSVVKKNQVKSGFEDVVCTIGGQTVGGYGDEISVGIQ